MRENLKSKHLIMIFGCFILAPGLLGFGQSDRNAAVGEINIVFLSHDDLTALPGQTLEELLAHQTGFITSNGVLSLYGNVAAETDIYIDCQYSGRLEELNHNLGLPITAIESITISNPPNGPRIDIQSSRYKGFGLTARSQGGFGYQRDPQQNTIYSFSGGGQIAEKLDLLLAYEEQISQDVDPSSGAVFSADRHQFEVDWSKLNIEPNPNGYEEISGELWVDGMFLGLVPTTQGHFLRSKIDELIKEQWADEYAGIFLQSGPETIPTSSIHYGLKNFSMENRIKPNTPFQKQHFYGRLNLKLGSAEYHLGYQRENSWERLYIHEFSLLNASHFPQRSTLKGRFFTGMNLAPNQQLRISLGLSYQQVSQETSDHHFGADLLRYGIADDIYPDLPRSGYNIYPYPYFGGFIPFGTVWNDYSRSSTDRLSLNSEVDFGIKNHRLKLSLVADQYTFRRYHIFDPVRLAKYIPSDPGESLTIDQRYFVYRNALTSHLGYDVTGGENKNSDYYQPSPKPIEARLNLQDIISFHRTSIKLGAQLFYFNPDIAAPADWTQIFMENGQVDRKESDYQSVPASTRFHPQLLITESFNDKAELFLKYHTASSRHEFDNLYLDDTFFAGMFMLGAIRVMPNPTLEPREIRNTQLGFRNQVSPKTQIEVSYYLNESRFGLEVENYFRGHLDNAEYIWTQLQSGESRRRSGLVSSLLLNPLPWMSIGSRMHWQADLIDKKEDEAEYYYLLSQSPLPEKSHTTFQWKNQIKLQSPKREGTRTETQIVLYHRYSLASMMDSYGSNAASILEGFNPLKDHVDDRSISAHYFDLNVAYQVKMSLMNAGLILRVNNVFDTRLINAIYGPGGNMTLDYNLSWFDTPPGQLWSETHPDGLSLSQAMLQDPAFFEKPRLYDLSLFFEF